MPTQKTITAYTFDELSEQAKNKAREWMRQDDSRRTDCDSKIIEDAKHVGLHVTCIGPGEAQVDLVPIKSASHVAARILREHGASTGTYAAAQQYQLHADLLHESAKHWEGPLPSEIFISTLEAEYGKMLRDERQFQFYGPGLDNDIRANEYLFSEEGTRTITL